MKKLWLVGVVFGLLLLGCSNPSNPGGNSNGENGNQQSEEKEEENPLEWDSENVFITRWKTGNTIGWFASGESSSNQIKLPLHPRGRYSFIVDWGDGSSRSSITSHNQAEITHTYATGGEYTVTISGTIEGFGFWRGASHSRLWKRAVGDSAKLLDVESWGPVKLHSHGGQFIRAENLSDFPATGTLDVSNVTDMNHMFYGASWFNQSLDNWNVSNVTDMSGMFAASSFNQPLDNWDVSSVTDMSSMFSGATSFNQSLNDWDVSGVTDMSSMFSGATSFNQPLDNWNVSNVTNMSGMLSSAHAFNQDIRVTYKFFRKF